MTIGNVDHGSDVRLVKDTPRYWDGRVRQVVRELEHSRELLSCGHVFVRTGPFISRTPMQHRVCFQCPGMATR